MGTNNCTTKIGVTIKWQIFTREVRVSSSNLDQATGYYDWVCDFSQSLHSNALPWNG
jgi:hypothetical protein